MRHLIALILSLTMLCCLLMPVALADNRAEMLLAVAVNELGYSATKGGYSKYGEWGGKAYGEWCSEFVSWCVAEADAFYGAGLLGDAYPMQTSCDDGAAWFQGEGRYVTAAGELKNAGAQFYYEDGVYYMYCTGWRVYKNTSGSIDGKWTQIKNAVVKPGDYKKNAWAPELYKYNGAYYLFTTYTPNYTRNEYENHGCIIMKADSPEGPFKMITDGWITPPEWDCIDGTLYVDPEGKPWMIFSREHTCLNGNGAFVAAQLSEDLTHFVSEPIELFRANDTAWSAQGITDGCFMYTTKEGDLLMLWSNNDEKGYCVGVARSSNGRLNGEWSHDELRLFSGWMSVSGEGNKIDGGHGMIFTDFDGQMYLVLHSPNDWGGDSSRMTFVPVIERNGTLVWDLNLE